MTSAFPPPVLTRRALLAAGAAALVGCSMPGSGDGTPGPLGRLTGPDAPEPSPTPPPAPPPYVVPAGEALPAFKQVAGDFAQSLATYDPGQPFPSLAFTGTPAQLQTAAAPLRVPDVWSRAEVEFVQYGGLSPVSPRATRGVAIVVLRQVLHTEKGKPRITRRTLDLRLHADAAGWRVEALASAGGARVERPAQLGALAQRVLDDPRIDLPDTLRWDVYSGQVSEQLLQVVLRLADTARMRATVLKTGHPQRVLDGRSAPPVSAHFVGRAIDINTLDDVPVADVPPELLRRFVEIAGSLPSVSQVGAPPGYDIDGRGRRGLTNLVHADHLHVAVRGGGG